MYDIAVIGGGVIGGTILRELSKYKISTIMLEKSSDVCMGQSKANSGIVHAGFDAMPGTLKAKYNVLGNKMMPEYASTLGVKYKNNHSIVVAFSDEDMAMLSVLLERGIQNGVEGLSIISREELKSLEPNISPNAVGALFARTGGIVCPYELTIAAIGNAMDNGAELKLNYQVSRVERVRDHFEIYSATGDTVTAKLIINCAGAGGEEIARLCGDDSIKIGFRRGEYVLLDRNENFVKHTLFFCPSKKGKGILVSPTADNNIILGPTADEIEEYSTSTTEVGLNQVKSKAREMVDNIPFFDTITSFAGVRAYSVDRHDFIIEYSSKVSGLINVVGIESPGLTSAPAIARYVADELIPQELRAMPNENFNPKRERDNWFKLLSNEEKNEVIKSNPQYGNIVCRCESITEGEIVEALHRNPKTETVDAVKRRTRAGMGRCQGGFCGPRVAEIIARERGISLSEVKKSDGDSYIVIGRTK